MISEEILDKICPVPDEAEEMEKIRQELSDNGFKINNFNKGGIFYIIIRIFVTIYIELKGLAREIINNLFVNHADEDWLEVKAGDFGKGRTEAVKTRGYVTLYRDEYENALQVTKGHLFKTSPDVNGNELKFYAVENTVIGAGEQSGKVLVEAEKTGTGYNVLPGKIVVSMIHLDGVQRVENEQNWLVREGADIEDIERFRERVKASWSEVAELPTEDKLRNVARKVSGVLDVQLNAQHPRGQGTTDIIITSVNGEATDELLHEVEEATRYLKGNYDDFLYKSSTIIRQDMELTIYVSRDMSVEGIREMAEHTIEELMKLEKRSEVNCLYMDDIRYALMNKIEGYRRAVFMVPEADVELSKDHVVMLGDLTIHVQNTGGE